MNFKSTRQLHVEGLEQRQLLAADVAGPAIDHVPAHVATVDSGDICSGLSISGAAAQSAQAAGDIWPDTISLPTGFEPKGIELGKGHDFFVSAYSWSSLLGPLVGNPVPVSEYAGAIYKGDLRTGEGEILVEDTGRPILGISYDARTDSIYAGVGDPKAITSPGPFQNVGIVVYNGTTGEKVDEIIIGNGPFLSGILVVSIVRTITVCCWGQRCNSISEAVHRT